MRVILKKKPSEIVSKQEPDICTHAGVRIIVEAILRSRKPLIGFQAIGDLAYMIGGIYKELPRKIEDFLKMMEEEIPVLVDLKAIAESKFLEKEGLGVLSLQKAYAASEKWNDGVPELQSSIIRDGHINAHDAGNRKVERNR